jgi:hypothetical protein
MTRRPGPDIHRNERAPEPGGLACPDCGARIPVTIETLLARRPLSCPTPGCGIILRLDPGRSGEAIDALRDLKHRLRG